MDWPTTASFLAASLMILIMPGPVMTVLAHNTLRGGVRIGVSTVIGVELGRMSALSMTLGGLALTGEFFPSLFGWLTVAGAAYLLWLAARALYQQHRSRRAQTSARNCSKPLIDGLAVAFSNPATLVFYASFFPQFMTSEQPIVLQALTLAAIFLTTSLLFELSLVLTLTCLRSHGSRHHPGFDIPEWSSAIIYVSIAAIAVFGLARPFGQ